MGIEGSPEAEVWLHQIFEVTKDEAEIADLARLCNDDDKFSKVAYVMMAAMTETLPAEDDLDVEKLKSIAKTGEVNKHLQTIEDMYHDGMQVKEDTPNKICIRVKEK